MKFIYTLLQVRCELILADLFETGEGKKKRHWELKGKGHQVKGRVVKKGDEEQTNDTFSLLAVLAVFGPRLCGYHPYA